MKLTMTKIAAATALAMASTAAMAVPVAATSMHALTGSFDLGGSPGTPGTWNFSGAATELIGAQNTAFGSSFTFFGNPVNTFVGDGTFAPYGGTPVSGGNPISASVDAAAGTITVDLSSFTAYWNGTNFNQGTPSATGTYNAGNGTFDIAWSSTVVGGPFDGQTGHWSLQGNVTAGSVAAVPEASTYGMMLAGLGLVGFAVRRRKLTA